MEQNYVEDFQRFLQHTDEKEVLLGEIRKKMSEYGSRSLLDIGAGNGLVAIPLSQSVDEYTAIESKDVYVSLLEDAGLHVIRGRFPLEVPQKYDAVLFSHVISYLQPNYDILIAAAWECINPGGILIIVTYRGEEDDWMRFMQHLNLSNPSHYKDILQDMVNLLSSRGEVKTSKVITTVETETLEDMISALSFVASNGVPERKRNFMEQKEKIRQFLVGYKTNGGYFFPFQHFVIVTRKV